MVVVVVMMMAYSETSRRYGNNSKTRVFRLVSRDVIARKKNANCYIPVVAALWYVCVCVTREERASSRNIFQRLPIATDRKFKSHQCTHRTTKCSFFRRDGGEYINRVEFLLLLFIYFYYRLRGTPCVGNKNASLAVCVCVSRSSSVLILYAVDFL